MRPIEERLTAALQARAEQVQPEMLGPAAIGVRRTRRRRSAAAVPLLVAAAMIGGVAIGLFLPSLLGGSGPGLAAGGGDTVRTVTCWDGTGRESLRKCTEPDGVDGLAWVFPSFDPTAENCRDAKEERDDVSRPGMWLCEIDAPSGEAVTVRYSRVVSVQKALTHYVDKYSAGSHEVVTGDAGSERYVWAFDEPDADGLVKTSSMYVGHPFSASVDASRVEDRDWVLQQVLRFRPAGEIRGTTE